MLGLNGLLKVPGVNQWQSQNPDSWPCSLATASEMQWLKCTHSARNVLRQQLPVPQDRRSVVCERSTHGCLEFLLHNEHSLAGSEIRNVWLLWLEANSLFAEICVLMLLMFSFHSLVRAIKEIVFLADRHNPCWMRTSGNLNFCHLTAERHQLPGWLFSADVGGKADTLQGAVALLELLSAFWGAHTGSKPCAWLCRCS